MHIKFYCAQAFSTFSFILDCAKESGLKLSEYGLPSTLDGLCDQTKKEEAVTDSRFYTLFNDLAMVCPEVIKLKSCLCYLRNSVYSANEDGIRAIFDS